MYAERAVTSPPQACGLELVFSEPRLHRLWVPQQPSNAHTNIPPTRLPDFRVLRRPSLGSFHGRDPPARE